MFLIFIDDLHLDFRLTPRTRDLMQRMLKNLVHDGDMFGIVSTGTSSISEQLTYDRQVLEAAVSRVTGGGLRPEDMIKSMQSGAGACRAAVPRARRVLDRLSADEESREPPQPAEGGHLHQQRLRLQSVRDVAAEVSGGAVRGRHGRSSRSIPFSGNRQGQQFAESDLVRELAELTRAANRANATLYTIDPRGLVAGQDLGDEQVETRGMAQPRA